MSTREWKSFQQEIQTERGLPKYRSMQGDSDFDYLETEYKEEVS